MKRLTLFFSLIIFISCQNSQETKVKNNSTLQSELTKAIANSAWTYIDFDNNLSTIIDFSNNNELSLSAFRGVSGPSVLNLKGNWHIEDDYISVTYDNVETKNKWIISEDFSSITNNLGVKYLVVKRKKVINLNLEELKRKYQFTNSKKITDYSKPQSVDKEIGPDYGLQKALKIIGNRFEGECKVGNVYGSSIIEIDQKKVSVNYSAMGYSATERGVLENLELKDDGENNTYRISGNWNNQDAGDGIFRLEVYGTDKPNTVYLAIEGSSWKYYSNIKLSDEDFEKFIAIFLKKSQNDQKNNLKIDKSPLTNAKEESVPTVEIIVNDDNTEYFICM